MRVEPAVLCAIVSAFLWLLYFYFARHISYIGDDIVMLGSLFGGGLRQALHTNVRPLEYLVAWSSAKLGFSLWLVVSFLNYVATSLLTLALLRTVIPNNALPAWVSLICASTPLAANTYFQVDTVSQELANTFSLALALVAVKYVEAKDKDAILLRSGQLLLLAFLCILSKETSYGIVWVGSLLLLLRRQWASVAVFLCIQSALVVAVVWGYFFTIDITPGTHYGLKNPLYWIFAFIFSVIVPLSPVPTSIALTGGVLASKTLIGICVLGAGFFVAGALLYAPALLARMRRHDVPSLGLRAVTPLRLILVFVLFSLVPSLFFKASELYASQALPFLKVLLIAGALQANMRFARVFWPAVSVTWSIASIVNIIFYSLQSGYQPQYATFIEAEKLIYSAIASAQKNQSFRYSIYSMDVTHERVGACIIDRHYPNICLPENIASGFPHRIPSSDAPIR